MDYSLEWKPEFFEPVVIHATVILSLVGYWFTIHSSVLHEIFKRKYGDERAKIKWIFFWRYAGVFYFLLIPVIVIFTLLSNGIAEYGVGAANLSGSLIWILGLGSLIVLFQSIFARKQTNLTQYPQIRVQVWDISLVIKNSLGWLIYLISYEFMFRGFLLFGSVYAFGVWPAILVNTALYSLAHVPKGAREAIMAVPFGIIICCLTLRTGTIWVAVFAHFILAVSNDIFSLIAHQEMKFKNK